MCDILVVTPSSNRSLRITRVYGTFPLVSLGILESVLSSAYMNSVRVQARIVLAYGVHRTAPAHQVPSPHE